MASVFEILSSAESTVDNQVRLTIDGNNCRRRQSCWNFSDYHCKLLLMCWLRPKEWTVGPSHFRYVAIKKQCQSYRTQNASFYSLQISAAFQFWFSPWRFAFRPEWFHFHEHHWSWIKRVPCTRYINELQFSSCRLIIHRGTCWQRTINIAENSLNQESTVAASFFFLSSFSSSSSPITFGTTFLFSSRTGFQKFRFTVPFSFPLFFFFFGCISSWWLASSRLTLIESCSNYDPSLVKTYLSFRSIICGLLTWDAAGLFFLSPSSSASCRRYQVLVMSIALIIIHNAPHRFGPRSGSCLRLLCSPFTKAVLPPPPSLNG